MPKKKKGAFGKKAARKRATAVASASTKSKNIASNGHNSSNHLQQWSIGSAATDPTLPGTSMQQLALNTRNKASHWDQNSSLRGRPVAFVSGGFMESSEEAQISDGDSSSKVATNLPSSKGTDCPQHSAAPAAKHVNADDGAESPQVSFNADAGSSDEEILFKGRGALQDARPVAPAKIVLEPAEVIANTSTDSTQPPVHSTSSDSNLLNLLIADSDDDGGSDAAINDYIENMSSEDMADMVRQLATNRRQLGGTHDDIVVGMSSSDTESSGERSINTGDDNADGEDGSTSGGPHKQNKTHDMRCQGRNTHKRTNSVSSTDDSDDEWQLAADIDDEHFARLLAKQEELGMGGDDLILFDAIPSRRATRSQRQLDKQRRRSKRLPPWETAYDFTKGYRASRGSYPSAEAVADAFEQLEVTGWPKNGDELQLELSDSDLEAALKSSWQKDRMRKKEKKKAREELRSQGLLKKNANPNDPRIKYPNGMSLDDMKVEFRSFLLGSENSVTLSPMDAHARKVVHEIAYRFNITSKSTGSGDQRRPTLVRKKSTLRFDDDLFQTVFAKYQRRFFARLDGNKIGTGFFKKTLDRKGGGPGAATVRNGEVVGASAPEIGVQNKGRTMLEKMGWSTGMALGAVDNKGITQIIEHVVKRSKAGLG